MDEDVKERKNKNIIMVNEFYYGLMYLIAFIFINFIVGFFSFVEMIINFGGLTLVIIILLIKEGGIKYELKR